MRRRAVLAILLLAAHPARTELLPLPQVVRMLEQRYLGRMIEAEARPGRPHERTQVVYELRWLTQSGQVLRIRVSADDGAMLEVEGAGLLEARRP